MPTSRIDPTKPQAGRPTTESVRTNFQRARDEIDSLFAATTGDDSYFLQKSLALGDIPDLELARNNLGLGSMAFASTDQYTTAEETAAIQLQLSNLTALVAALGTGGTPTDASSDTADTELLTDTGYLMNLLPILEYLQSQAPGSNVSIFAPPTEPNPPRYLITAIRVVNPTPADATIFFVHTDSGHNEIATLCTAVAVPATTTLDIPLPKNFTIPANTRIEANASLEGMQLILTALKVPPPT